MVTTRTLHSTRDESRQLRWLNFVLGGWLVISAFAWTHSDASFTNSWLTGLAIAGIAVVGIFAPRARWVNSVVALWLFVSTLYIEHATTTTLWHNAILAVVVFGVSLMPATPQRRVPHGTIAPMTR